MAIEFLSLDLMTPRHADPDDLSFGTRHSALGTFLWHPCTFLRHMALFREEHSFRLHELARPQPVVVYPARRAGGVPNNGMSTRWNLAVYELGNRSAEFVDDCQPYHRSLRHRVLNLG